MSKSTIKVKNVVMATKSIGKSLKLVLPFPKIRKIIQLKDRLKPDAEAYALEEKKLADYFAANGFAKISNSGIDFKVNSNDAENEKNLNDFILQRECLRETEIEWDFSIINITDAEIGNQPISGEDIENLAPFITFGGD